MGVEAPVVLEDAASGSASSGSSMLVPSSSFLRESHQPWIVGVGMFQKSEASA